MKTIRIRISRIGRQELWERGKKGVKESRSHNDYNLMTASSHPTITVHQTPTPSLPPSQTLLKNYNQKALYS
jgi:hypothetical protein